MTIKRKGFRQGVEGAGIILFPDIFRAALVPSGLLVYVSLTSVTSNRKGPHGKSYLCTSWQTEFSVIQALGILEESLCGKMWELIHFMANRRGKVEAVTNFIFLGSKISMDGDCSHEIKRHSLLGTKVMTNLDSVLKKQRHHFDNKSLCSQSYVFSGSHVWMWKSDHEEGWAPKNGCF